MAKNDRHAIVYQALSYLYVCLEDAKDIILAKRPRDHGASLCCRRSFWCYRFSYFSLSTFGTSLPQLTLWWYLPNLTTSCAATGATRTG